MIDIINIVDIVYVVDAIDIVDIVDVIDTIDIVDIVDVINALDIVDIVDVIDAIDIVTIRWSSHHYLHWQRKSFRNLMRILWEYMGNTLGNQRESL